MKKTRTSYAYSGTSAGASTKEAVLNLLHISSIYVSLVKI